ncbi:MotA/TolQ/ExbB proton channel family protein [Balneola sp. MJW-20]|uniref:MotA/TolQ/ExbB proton channel family protein n=1 Tax=Gracilimonas aurantiaca TaxID=3234185 RepID=UPI003466BD74
MDQFINTLGIVFLALVYGLLLGWFIYSIYYINKSRKAGSIIEINDYILDSIPTVFTTIGVLGTFVGIFFGLLEFDTKNITESTEQLLIGLKTAFLSSIIGIILSLIFGRITQYYYNSLLKRSGNDLESDPIVAGLSLISQNLENARNDSNRHFESLNKNLIGDSDFSISTQLAKVRNTLSDQNTNLEKVQAALGGDDETSLLTQIQKLRAEQNDHSKEARKNIEFIVESMNSNNELIRSKFDEFSELLAKSNTEALVEVMKQATEEFNAQMRELIDRLVKENFEELNNSVNRMNQWQLENKEMIQSLTSQFEQVSNDFSIASSSIKEISENTSTLTNENSHLTKLIEDLQNVMIDDTKFQDITNKITGTVDTLKTNTEAFDATTNKLNEWVRNQMSFSDSVSKLLIRLEEIDKIKDINEVFWNNTKNQLNEGVGIIEKASNQLSNDLENINAEFYERLNDTLQNLDRLIQRIIQNYSD